MILRPQEIKQWPRLAWVARIHEDSAVVDVFHGPCVETGEEWCAEAVWPGHFREGDFDRTELVFGTGIHCRADTVTFVSSGTILDRLWYCHRRGHWYVSNSLPALLAAAGLSLLEDHSYIEDWETVWRQEGCCRSFPTADGQASVIWFNNLLYDGKGIKEVTKPDTAPRFVCFGDYCEYLRTTAEHLGANLDSAARAHKVTPFASISSGYDSPAVAAIARHAGCVSAATIAQATSLWRGSDSGEAIAARLKMSCQVYDRTARDYPYEETVWAAAARPGLLSLTRIDYPEPVCLFFTGFYGDTMWERHKIDPEAPLDLSIRIDLGLGEFRLWKGVLHCVVPFWGMRRVREIRYITYSQEMAPWTLHSAYDRPIPRRILEEAGLPRGEFAKRKKNTSQMAAFLWPYSPRCRESFARYLKDRRVACPPSWALPLIRRIAYLDKMVHLNITSRFRIRKSLRDLVDFRGCDLLFQWANAELRDLYDKGLRAAGIDVR